MDIGGYFTCVFFRLNECRVEASLKGMAAKVFAFIEIACIHRVYQMHDFREMPAGSFDQEMVMIGHQAVGMNNGSELIVRASEAIKEVKVISFHLKDGLPLISPRTDVIKGPREFNPKRPCHLLFRMPVSDGSGSQEIDAN